MPSHAPKHQSDTFFRAFLEPLEPRQLLSGHAWPAAAPKPPKPVVTAAVTDDIGYDQTNEPAHFRLTRTGSTSGALTVTISLSGTAKNNVDYNYQPLTVTFAPGYATADIVITPKSDGGVAKPTKTVLMTVKSGSAYKVGTTAAQKVSLEDDLPLSDYFPTTMGTWWHYTGKMAGGKDFDSYQRISENLTINGLLTTEMLTTVGSDTIASDYFIVAPNGLSFVRASYGIEHGSETQTYDTPLLTMPATFLLGATYTGQATYTSTRTTGGDSTGTETRQMLVAGKVQKVTVPFGTYSAAIEVTLSDTWTDADGWHGQTTKNYWVVDGIGVVKATVKSTSADSKNANKFSFGYTASMASWST